MRVLLLGGTAEASAIARGLAGDARFAVTLSYAGRTRAPMVQPVATRSGGFGGVAGLVDYLRHEGVDALVDATHPFAARMKANAANAAAQAGVPRLAVLRPPWVAGPGDDWTLVPGMAQAAAALGLVPRCVLLTVGQQDLAAFGPPHRYVVRSVDPPARPPAGAIVLTGRGPFDPASELALLRHHRVEVLVTKASGGADGKLWAARMLGLPVVMVARPPPPDGPIVPDADAALRWLHGQAACRGV